VIKQQTRQPNPSKREKKMGEMVSDQIANKAAELLKKGGKKKRNKKSRSGTVELQAVLAVLLLL
jgi:hypothetical protein